MNNCAMNNETGLDWLARNVHVWPEGKREVLVCYPRNVDALIWSCVLSTAGWITKDQWLARRAELQNKPGWDDFGESAKFMAQDSDGAWMAFESEPAANYHVWSSMRGWCGYAREGRDRCRGEVLGDWRDTLEKRPGEFKPSIEEANRLAQEFRPFTSIEDNQEKGMKQDNGWFERGELPPVGTECEIDLGAKWRKAFVVGRNYTGRIVVEIDTCDFIVADGCTFRPIRTEREVLIEIIKKTDDTDDRIADAILAAGFKLEVK